MTKSIITGEESIQTVFDLKVGYTLGLADIEILKRVARMALTAMDSEQYQVVPDAATAIRASMSEFPESVHDIVEECADIAENACRATMLNQK